MPEGKRLHEEENSISFFEMVHQVTKLVPYGRVTSYGAIAKYLGAARSARMVGWALNSSKVSIDDIPAHRVVNRLGQLSGKAHFKNVPMEDLLKAEGIVVENLQIVNFKQIFWDPGLELSLDAE